MTYGLSGRLFIFWASGFGDFHVVIARCTGMTLIFWTDFWVRAHVNVRLTRRDGIWIAPKSREFAQLKKAVVWVGQRGHVELLECQIMKRGFGIGSKRRFSCDKRSVEGGLSRNRF